MAPTIVRSQKKETMPGAQPSSNYSVSGVLATTTILLVCLFRFMSLGSDKKLDFFFQGKFLKNVKKKKKKKKKNNTKNPTKTKKQKKPQTFPSFGAMR